MSQLTTVKLCSKCVPQRVEQFGKAGIGVCQGCHEQHYLSNINLHALLLHAHDPETEHGKAALVALAQQGFRHYGRRCAGCSGYHIYKLPTTGGPWLGVLQSPEEYAVHFGVTLSAAQRVFRCPPQDNARASDEPVPDTERNT